MTNDKDLLVKYWAGWLMLSAMDVLPNWPEAWKIKAIEAERENFDLMVFKIPKDRPDLVAAIEKLLQEKID